MRSKSLCFIPFIWFARFQILICETAKHLAQASRTELTLETWKSHRGISVSYIFLKMSVRLFLLFLDTIGLLCEYVIFALLRNWVFCQTFMFASHIDENWQKLLRRDKLLATKSLLITLALEKVIVLSWVLFSFPLIRKKISIFSRLSLIDFLKWLSTMGLDFEI